MRPVVGWVKQAMREITPIRGMVLELGPGAGDIATAKFVGIPLSLFVECLAGPIASIIINGS